jgi:hypothetical protein
VQTIVKMERIGMSTSLLCHGFGIRGYRHVRTEYMAGGVEFTTACYEYAILTGPLEGTNNKIKTVKRQTYGFRDRQFFIAKICVLHESRYALVG